MGAIVAVAVACSSTATICFAFYVWSLCRQGMLGGHALIAYPGHVGPSQAPHRACLSRPAACLQAAVARSRDAPLWVGAVDAHALQTLKSSSRVLQSLQRNLVHGSCKNFVLHTQKHTEAAVATNPAVVRVALPSCHAWRTM